MSAIIQVVKSTGMVAAAQELLGIESQQETERQHKKGKNKRKRERDSGEAPAELKKKSNNPFELLALE